MPAPVVSWLMPFWLPPEGHLHDPRRLAWLSLAIQSIQQQSWGGDWEAILVSDGNDWRAVDDVQQLCDIDHRFKLIEKGHSGVAGSLNAGLPHCRGDWIARLDSDDVATPCRLDRQLSLGSWGPCPDVIGGQAAFIGPDGEDLRRDKTLPRGHDAIAAMIANGHCPMCHPATTIRKSSLEKAGGWPDDPRREDYLLWKAMLGMGFQFANLGEIMVQYRIHAGQASKQPVIVAG